jgi:hypothetical protein
VDPRDFQRDPDYVPTDNIEDIYARWDALVPPELAEPLREWVHELVRRAPSAFCRCECQCVWMRTR